MNPHLAKVHAFHALTTQRRTDRRARSGLAGAHDQLDHHVILQKFPGRHG